MQDKADRHRRLALAVAAALLLPAASIAPFVQAQPAVQPTPSAPDRSTPIPLTPAETQSLVQRVLRTEIEAVQDLSHPMQYRLRKSSPRFSSTKLIVETKDGDVARLVEVNHQPLSAESQKIEADRLQSL